MIFTLDNNVQALGRIGFDKSIVDAMVNARTIIEHKESLAKEEITAVWNRIEKELS